MTADFGPGKLITYADDLVVFGNCLLKTQAIADCFVHSLQQVGLSLSKRKSEVVHVGDLTEGNVFIKNKALQNKELSEFIYLDIPLEPGSQIPPKVGQFLDTLEFWLGETWLQ